MANLTNIIQTVRKLVVTTHDMIEDEFHYELSQDKLNELLHTYVTEKVNAVIELRAELFDGYLTLYFTLNAMGIYATVAGDFRLVHMQVDHDVQRFVFEQLSYTRILDIKYSSSIRKVMVKFAVFFYHKLLKRDPLGFILNKLNLAKTKSNLIYLDINRFLRKNEKIMNYLQKAQINHGMVETGQLIVVSQVNFDNIIKPSSSDIVAPIEAAQTQRHTQKPDPISDALRPTNAT